ncbi:dynein regulatory complex protein 1-like [Anneissia japonica]|uniref:dynein regulatory complex protein 1-like n=1 Tax=Anneissia japonica TaxID=1529436 RepID=UPI0014257CF7|nr:dynein regulatory complex protein 1-like [Anneissia japonica]
MNVNDEEEDQGPSVDSNDQEERIAARRIRIKKRIEAAKRQALGEDPNAKKKEDKEEQSKSRKQVEESRQRLTKLKSDGNELVSNVRVAADSREAQRRNDEEENTRQRLERLEAEAKAAVEKFDEITKKWENANGKDIPQELHEVLISQRALCDAMIDEKNKLINDFQMELKSKDDQYVKDLKKQAEDTDLMIERMEEQIKNLTRAYRDELIQIEKAFETERMELLDNHKKKWDQGMQGRREQEVDYMKQRDKRVEDYEQQIKHLRRQDAEEYNMVKIKLETDVQVLEQQLQQMKATYQLNQEKLEYNFQVLKKRDEENTITKSQQKRKITRLQDVLNNLKMKLAKQEKSYREENQALADDYKRITEQFKELQKKSKHFQATDTRKFQDIWLMNEGLVKEQAKKVLEQDRIIMEHQLGLAWKSPDLSFMDNTGPLISAKTQQKSVSAQQVLMEVMSADGSQRGESDTSSLHSQMQTKEDDEEGGLDDAVKDSKLSVKTIKRVLELICDESGFLVEAKLNKLLLPLERDERSLMKLDAIFAALNIETEDDIHNLVQYFIATRHDPETEPLHPLEALGTPAIEPSAVHPPEGQQTPVEPDQQTFTKRVSILSEKKVSMDDDAASHDITGQEKGNEEDDAVIGMKQDDVASMRSFRSNVSELIHPNDVVRALRAFVEDHRQPSKEKQKQQTFNVISAEERDDSKDAEYWACFPTVLSEQKEKVWTALLDGLERYSNVLTERSKLITETESYQQQNAELRMLLHQYINSRVNQELEIPPTRVLNLDVQ